MSNKMIFLEKHLAELRALLFDIPGVEGAAFILCGEAVDESGVTLMSHAVIKIDDDDFLKREPWALSIKSHAFMRVTKLAKYENLSVIFAHSHPGGMALFSEQDDKEEASFIPFLQERCPGKIHGTVVLNDDSIVGRVFSPQTQSVNKIEIIGDKFKFVLNSIAQHESLAFDRQVRAFGKPIQDLLKGLHVGIVGLGGTGSPLAQQLYRLGVGELTLFDGDTLDESNLNRVYGSRFKDIGEFKVTITKRALDDIGLNIKVNAINRNITNESTAKLLRNCDIVFGCTDKQLPRAILTKLAIQYSIPVIDMGVLIDSENNKIVGVHGRVTTLLPGEACLFCRGRISPEAIRVETLTPDERSAQAKEGYAPELDDPAPSVIAFTTGGASAAISELLHRLTGFMGAERQSSEILFFFDQNKIRTNRVESRENCMCSDQAYWGRGDEKPFLGMVWPIDESI